MSRPPLVTTRRTALGGSMVALAATASCDLDPRDGPGAEPRPGPVTSAPAVDADDDLVADVLARLSAAHAAVRGAQRDHPRLKSELTDLEGLHRSHARELGGLVPARIASTPLEPVEQARARVVAIEQRLQRQLVSASVAAGSGALASLLASMAAAVAQRLAFT